MDQNSFSDEFGNLTFFSAGDEVFPPLWEKFVKENSHATWRYLPRWREFQNYYDGAFLIQDLSFLIADPAHQPLAVCSLFLEKTEKHRQFSYGLSYQPAPVIRQGFPEKRRRKIEALCFKKIDDLAKCHDVTRSMILADPLGVSSQHNVLQEYGYFDVTLSSLVLDLSLPKMAIWTKLRRSFQPLINKALKKYDIKVYDYKNPDYQIHEQYRELHRKAAGRVTRPKETFDLQYEMLREDNAVLVGAQWEGQWIAFDYFFHNHRNAYYGSAADDPSVKLDTPVGHAVIWSAVAYYLMRNFEHLDMGPQQFGPQWLDYPSAKDINIAFFKRGFGGDLVPVYRGIKYYDPQLLKADLQQWVEKFNGTDVGSETI